MMRWSAIVFVFVGCRLLLAPTAEAVDVVAGWDTATRWDSNVFNSSETEESDIVIRTGPLLELTQRQGDFTGRLRWRSLWEGFLDNSDANNFEHFVDLDGAWQISARNRLEITNRFARTDSVTAQLAAGDGTVLSPGQGIDVGTDSSLQNLANATFSHELTPTLSLTATVDNSLFDFENDDNSDSFSTRGSLDAIQAISYRTRLGIGAAFTRQDFEGTQGREDSGADIIEVFGIWNYQITPTLIMSTRVGPALNRPDEVEIARRAPEFPTILSPPVPTPGGLVRFPTLIDASTCPLRSDGSRVLADGCAPAVGQDLATGDPRLFAVDQQAIPLIEAMDLTGGTGSDDAMTLFGAWSLIKRWERASARLSLQRRSSAASGDGVSTDLTLANVSLSWQPDQRSILTATAGWALQTSASDVPFTEFVVRPETLFVDGNGLIVDDPALALVQVDGAAVTAGVREAGSSDNAFESTTYQLVFGATRDISRRLAARASMSFFRSESGGDLQADSTTDSVRFEIGLRWKFDPFFL